MIEEKKEWDVVVGRFEGRVTSSGKVTSEISALTVWDRNSIKQYINFLEQIYEAMELAANNPADLISSS